MRFVCFGRRVHCACVCALPPGGGWVGWLTGGLVRRLVGTGLHGPQDRVWAPSTAFLAGKVFPEPLLGAEGMFALVGESTARLCARCRRAGVGLGGWHVSFPRGKVRLAGRREPEGAHRRYRAARRSRVGLLAASCWEPDHMVLIDGCGLPALCFLSGEGIPRTPSRRVRRVCFGRRVHGSCVPELPPFGSRVG